LSDESGRAQNPPVAWCYLTPAPNDPGLQLVGTFFILHKTNSTYSLLGDGESLRTQAKFPGIIAMIVLSGSICYAATVTGTVKDPKGAPFAGAFVQAQNIKTHVTFMALSDVQGRYRVENIPPGDYRILIRAIGYRTDPRSDINLTADQNTSFDFALQKAVVRWNDISIYQAKRLLPASVGKDKLFADCFVCHGFQTRMAAVRRDAEGWKDRVQFMRDAMHFSLVAGFSDKDAADVAVFLNDSFGNESKLTRSPADLSLYKDSAPTFTSKAMNIKFVEFDMPGPSRMPFSAAPGIDGYIWIPNFGLGNKITRLDPTTGLMEDFPVPFTGTAAVHSAVEAPDGSVWLAEQGSNRLGKWDPKTGKITEYQDTYLPGKEGQFESGSKHTVRFDPGGNIWSTGFPLSRMDPETGKFTDFWDVASHTYGLEPDRDGNIWFTNPGTGQIGRADWKTLKIKQWTVPTPGGYERRLAFDSEGILWFGEYENGKIGRFDPKTETFREYDLPGGKDVFPYAVGIDSDDYVWYSSYYRDTLGRLDPETGKIVEYPFPHSENTIREFFRDPQGRMWYGSPSNNRVGYFYLTNGNSQPNR
jgi:virginiamycin B lyase